MKAIKWSDNDKYFGPLTISKNSSDWNPIAFVLESGGEESPNLCRLRVSVFRLTLIIRLPAIIKPWREWVDTSKYDWGRENGGYYSCYPREYGFSYHDGFLQVFLGPQTHDSATTKMWCKHLPWTEWRHVRHSFYDTEGNHWWTARKDWNERYEMEQKCPSVSFKFEDYDGEIITAKTHIEEREWKFGQGWFKWLSIFRRNMITRSLDIDFSSEVGPEKGSWKGGTVGHGIEMRKGELHEDAFRRYCNKEHKSKNGKFKLKYMKKLNELTG